MVSPHQEDGNRTQLTPPSRSALAAAPRRFIKQGPRHKADLYAVDLGSGEIAVKDFASKPWWVRLAGRFQIGHESRAYLWLGEREGIPRFYGRIDAMALAIELIDGGELVCADDRFSQRRRHLHGLRTVVSQFLDAGFFHLDSRGRRNVMVRASGQVVVIDLAGSLWIQPGTLRYRLVRPLLESFYKSILHKWRKLLSPGRSQRDEKSSVSKALEFVRMPHHWFEERRKRRDARRDRL